MQIAERLPWRSVFFCAVLAACGTDVTTGENLERGRAQALDAEQEGEDPVIDPSVIGDDGGVVLAPDGTVLEPGDSSSGGTTGGTPGGGSGAGLTCFGAAPALSADVDTFCTELRPDLREIFATPLGLICDDRRLVNLTLKPCSWSGDGASDRYRRTLFKTDLADQTTTDFASLIAYGSTTESDPEAQAALILREMHDPDYRARFVTIRNSRVYDTEQIGDRAYEYSAALASSAATVSFRARVEAWTVSPNLTVVFDYSIGDTVILKEHRYLRLIFRGDAGTSRIIGVDEKVIGDGGSHQISYQNVTDVLKQRMERDYENSRRD